MEYQWSLSRPSVDADLPAKDQILTKTQALAAMRELLPTRPDVGLYLFPIPAYLNIFYSNVPDA